VLAGFVRLLGRLGPRAAPTPPGTAGATRRGAAFAAAPPPLAGRPVAARCPLAAPARRSAGSRPRPCRPGEHTPGTAAAGRRSSAAAAPERSRSSALRRAWLFLAFRWGIQSPQGAPAAVPGANQRPGGRGKPNGSMNPEHGRGPANRLPDWEISGKISDSEGTGLEVVRTLR